MELHGIHRVAVSSATVLTPGTLSPSPANSKKDSDSESDSPARGEPPTPN
jgi:hypothetical protein